MKRKVRAAAPEPCLRDGSDATRNSEELFKASVGDHMASDGTPGKIPVASLVQGSQAAKSTSLISGSGTAWPPNGKIAAPPAASAPASAVSAGAAAVPTVTKAVVPQTTDPRSLVQNLNKFLNDSGRPDQFRLDPASGGKLIQQINPATGAVIGEFSATEFPALARSVGVAGLLVDSLA
jgi:hypothetical protein